MNLTAQMKTLYVYEKVILNEILIPNPIIREKKTEKQEKKIRSGLPQCIESLQGHLNICAMDGSVVIKRSNEQFSIK